ncbi:acyltransferase domain-containing protein [Streptomyces sp. M19]
MEASPVFAAAMAECEQALVPFVDWSLWDVLDDEVALGRVEVVQPVLWAVMVSLAELWRSCGVVPGAVVGHSQGRSRLCVWRVGCRCPTGLGWWRCGVVRSRTRWRVAAAWRLWVFPLIVLGCCWRVGWAVVVGGG